ncbi:MAG: hypothetical protein GY777_32100 [Candidatus Brocadiaceae bacterium]|nr:hypothetical protein [Candidatus Brocadiaceae bacterium]
MSALIEKFKMEHYEIIEVLKEVGGACILAKEGQSKLMSAKATLLDHIKVEDEKFYPVIWKVADQDKKLKEALEVFAKDLQSVTKVVLGFFDKYDKCIPSTRPLTDFETFYMVLCNRMRNEEDFLCVEYEKIAILFLKTNTKCFN